MSGGAGHIHAFDAESGYCAYCSLRDDGRLVGPGGHIYQPGHHHDAEEAHA